MTAWLASDMQIERLTFTWTPLDESADPSRSSGSVVTTQIWLRVPPSGATSQASQ